MSLRKAKELYNGRLHDDTFETLVSIDSTKTKKYLPKLCGWVVEEQVKVEELYNSVSLYDNLLLRKVKGINPDIYLYKSYKKDFLPLLRGHKFETPKSAIKKSITKEVEYVVDNEHIQVVCPKTREESILFGKGTKWCVSGSSNGYAKTWKEYYFRNGYTFYYIWFKKKKPLSRDYKMAMVVLPEGGINDVYDSTDKMLGNDQIQKLLLELDKCGLPKSNIVYKKKFDDFDTYTNFWLEYNNIGCVGYVTEFLAHPEWHTTKNIDNIFNLVLDSARWNSKNFLNVLSSSEHTEIFKYCVNKTLDKINDVEPYDVSSYINDLQDVIDSTGQENWADEKTFNRLLHLSENDGKYNTTVKSRIKKLVMATIKSNERFQTEENFEKLISSNNGIGFIEYLSSKRFEKYHSIYYTEKYVFPMITEKVNLDSYNDRGTFTEYFAYLIKNYPEYRLTNKYWNFLVEMFNKYENPETTGNNYGNNKDILSVAHLFKNTENGTDFLDSAISKYPDSFLSDYDISRYEYLNTEKYIDMYLNSHNNGSWATWRMFCEYNKLRTPFLYKKLLSLIESEGTIEFIPLYTLNDKMYNNSKTLIDLLGAMFKYHIAKEKEHTSWEQLLKNTKMLYNSHTNFVHHLKYTPFKKRNVIVFILKTYPKFLEHSVDTIEQIKKWMPDYDEVKNEILSN